MIRHDSYRLLLAGPDGPLTGGLRRGGDAVAVGDWVAVEAGIVTAVLPRSSLLRRRQSISDRQQLLAANVDLTVVVAGLDRPVKPGRLQRAIALAWDAGSVPLVVLSKGDLVDDPEAARTAVAAAHPGVEVLGLAALAGDGIDAVRRAAAGRTIVMLGESGAGKSTLANALVGSEVAATGAVRASDAKGRHTTTSRQLHLLPDGGAVIDTPGLRSLGLLVDDEAVDATFAEIDAVTEPCRFADCAHEHEPGCAVQAAVAEGRVPAARLEAWRAMGREARAATLRANAYALRRHGRRSSRVAREAQRRKGRD
ncbi:MAG: ribosome small subunit-dependent GTPase A [Acidimicrobiales bacterium]